MINWNGGAFVFDAHGADDIFCRYIADNTEYIVLDASYALAPEYPFPAGLEDAKELVSQVLWRPDVYENGIVLSGFSSGGNIALAAATNLARQLPEKTIRGVVAFYPPTDMTVLPAEKRLLDGSLPPVPAVLGIIMNAFRSSYLPPGTNAADPRISVQNADADCFPDNVLV